MKQELQSYFSRIYDARFFLFHLVKWDVKFKFRGSRLGLLWTTLQPLLLTFIIATVLGFVFKQDIADYAPYILSGLLVWDIINNAIVANSYSFLRAEQYIRQYAHPVVIYPLRMALVTMVTFAIASVSWLIWMLIAYPYCFFIGIISLPLTLFIYFIMAWACSIISSHLHIRFRDYPYIMSLIMQLLWYFSPVFLRKETFVSSPLLFNLFNFNPVTQALNLLRRPFFEGEFASLLSYAYVLCIAAVLLIIAAIVNRRCEKTVIFYF
ncbi:MAG: ABC transporter permease [Ruminococcaceae bacterium]|nr:ABC transporter permease [Oscillospiraceae bacterium]